jgi:hypothetical protein
MYLTHGSEDSEDLDRVYFRAPLPPWRECQRFCAEDPAENRNLAMISDDGVVEDCFKGLPDEVNNGVARTAPLHPQEHESPIRREVARVAPLKMARAARLILTRMTRTEQRAEIKAALRSHGWSQRLAVLASLDFRRHEEPPEVWKSLAFQVGQCLGLLDGHEDYTKRALAARWPALAPLLARAPATQAALAALNDHRDRWLARLEGLHVDQDGPLALLDGARDDDPFHRQCQGVILDLGAERLVAWPPPGPALAWTRYRDASGALALASRRTLRLAKAPAAALELALSPRQMPGFGADGALLGWRDRLTGDLTWIQPPPSPTIASPQ